MVTEESVGRAGRAVESAAAVSAAIIGVVSARGDDPVVPSERAETDEETLFATGRCGRTAVERSPPTEAARTHRVRVDDDERTVLFRLLPPFRLVRKLLFIFIVAVVFRLVFHQPPPPPPASLLPLVLLVTSVGGRRREQDGLDV